MHGISDALLDQIIALARRFSAEKLVLFGSRARGDNHDRSDIDLAVYGLPARREMAFRDALDDLPTLLKIDLVLMSQRTDDKLAMNINKDRVVLWRAET